MDHTQRNLAMAYGCYAFSGFAILVFALRIR